MKPTILTSLALLLVVVIVGCQKDNTPTPDNNAKTSILFDSPEENSVYQNGDTIPFHLTVATDNEVHGYSLYLTNRAKDTVYSKEEHAHNKQFNITDDFVANVTANDTMKLEFNLIIDHDGTTKTASETIYINR